MNTQIRNQLKWLVMATAVLGMGVAMPSCPGQQAMQQQIDALQTSQAEMTKRVQTMDAQFKASQTKIGQIEEFAKQATDAIQAQKAALESMGAAVKEIQARPVPAPARPAAKKPASKKRR